MSLCDEIQKITIDTREIQQRAMYGEWKSLLTKVAKNGEWTYNYKGELSLAEAKMLTDEGFGITVNPNPEYREHSEEPVCITQVSWVMVAYVPDNINLDESKEDSTYVKQFKKWKGQSSDGDPEW